ncbi:MAG TPA: hypothetical protein VM388_05900 [Acidimicrobiales bacterium]|nr:hypothetical protein [Acidimicrobiales bacterium]
MTELPDDAIEAFLMGDAHEAWEQDEALARLDSEVLMGATGPAPEPSAALRAFLGEPDAGSVPAPVATRPLASVPAGQPDTVAAGPAPSGRGTNVVPLFRRLRLTAGIAAAAGVAAATLAVTATTGVLPEPVMQAVSWVVEAVTPFELRDPARTTTGGDVPDRGPTSTVPAGSLDPGAGLGPAGPGGAPGQPAATTPVAGPGAPGEPGSNRPVTPPASVPAGVSGPVQPPGAVDQGGTGPPAPFVSVVPGPPGGIAPPADGGSVTPPTTPVDRAGQAPDGGTVPSTVAGPPNRR